MKRATSIALACAAVLATTAHAQVKLTAATSSKNSVPWYVTGHTAEVAAAKGVANIQMAEGQTLTVKGSLFIFSRTQTWRRAAQ